MIKKFVVIVALATLFVSCKKVSTPACPYSESTAVAPAGEIAAMQTYINSAHPGAVQLPSGVFYDNVTVGTGATPSVCSYITVKYTGTLTNGTKFDANQTGFGSYLGGLILGWQKGLPIIKSGGSITLYIPPSLGYGSQDQKDQLGNVIIPGNSILVFTIQLLAVQ